MSNKEIVVDFDDTISFTKNRDWENASCNVKLVEKLNGLYDEGWNIRIYTARGNLSCVNREIAFDTYGQQIIDFLSKWGVKYTELSFNKPLASYYIDDKGITPEDFLKLENVK